MKNFILEGQQSYKHITMKDFFILLFCLYAGQQNFKHISMKNLFILVVCQYAGQQSFKQKHFKLFLVVCLYAGQQSFKISYIYNNCKIFVSYLKL